MLWIPFVLQTVAWFPARLIFNIFLRLQIKDKENIKGLCGGVIFAVNHVSELDPILLPTCLNPFSKLMPMFYVSRTSEAYKHLGVKANLYGGRFFKLWGAYPVVVGLKNYEKSLEAHTSLLNKGKNVCIFPEGRRSNTPEPQKPKGGVVALSKATGKPIVPVAISGHFKMTYKDFFLRRRTVVVSFGKPISIEELLVGYEDANPKEYKEIAGEKVIKKIANLLAGNVK